MPTTDQSSLAQANAQFRQGKYLLARNLYRDILNRYPALNSLLRFNISLCDRKLNFTQENRCYYRILDQVKASIKDSKQRQALDQALTASQEIIQNYKAHKPTTLVSIIMPSYNRAHIMNASIQSVIEQTYQNWELIICDDGSQDNTRTLVQSICEPRIRYLQLSHQGAAAARNRGLELARGEIIAYLDTDNYWHPDYLWAMVTCMEQNSGNMTLYADYIDYRVEQFNQMKLEKFQGPRFQFEKMLKKPFIDLNSFAHRKQLYDCFGGFNESLKRRQDQDLITKYTWLRDPLHLACPMNLYQRNARLEQITKTQAHDKTAVAIIQKSVHDYYQQGLPIQRKTPYKRITIISWDISRNHFSKAFNLAQALSRDFDVQLIGFQFFEDSIFPPLAKTKPEFKTLYLPGDSLPEFWQTMEYAAEQVSGELIYAIKPKLPSLGVALLASQKKNIPIILEVNDLEHAAHDPNQNFDKFELQEFGPGHPDYPCPYSDSWTKHMEAMSHKIPVVTTHNRNIDQIYGGRCYYLRNLKDERIYDPKRYDRKAIRRNLGFAENERIILFGGLVRKHKGVREVLQVVRELNAEKRLYRLLIVGSRASPELVELKSQVGWELVVLDAQDDIGMAKVNLAADVVVLWLNPAVEASHYQMPYKLTDALAMGVPVIASPVSDLEVLGEQGYVRIVEFGDMAGLKFAIQNLDRRGGDLRRSLFLRGFSYQAALNVMGKIGCGHKLHKLPIFTKF